jgi:hypothetical protein
MSTSSHRAMREPRIAYSSRVSSRSQMRAWFVALAASIWMVVVAAGILLFAGVGFCYLVSVPSLRNASVCSTIGTTVYFDVIALFAGVPVLIRVDHVARNPSWLRRPLTIRVAYLWITLTLAFVLLSTFALLPAGLYPILLILWLGTGVTLATLLIARAVIRLCQKTCQKDLESWERVIMKGNPKT